MSKAGSLLTGVACAIALFVAGCGDTDETAGDGVRQAPVVGEGLPPEVRHPVADAVDRLQRAFASNDYDALCDDVTAGAARSAGRAAHGDASPCARDVRELFELIRKGNGWRHEGAPRVVDVKTNGSNAIATVALDRRWQARIAFARQRGRWHLDGVFGIQQEDARRHADRVIDAEFPPPGPDPVEVSDADGKPCPAVSTASYPKLTGGCRIRVSAAASPLVILTPFGDFVLERCSMSYPLRVDATGRTWTEEVDVIGGPDSAACGDVGSCSSRQHEPVPWRGRIYDDGDAGFVHRMEMCLYTCVGYFAGELTMRLQETSEGWRAEPVNGGGKTGLRLEAPFALKGDFELEAAQT